LLTALLRHHSCHDCLAELHRNPSLCRLLDITAEDQIPKGPNLSRFRDVLGQEPHLSSLRQVFDDLAQRLGRAVSELGRHTAGDATALNARPKANPKAVKAELTQGLPQPSGGRKEYKDDDGRVTEVVEWFGYKLHLLVDIQHEVALAYHVTDTKAGANERVGAWWSRPRPISLSGCGVRSICGVSRPYRARPGSSSGVTRGARRWSGSTHG
jgi:hypothetical protein